MRLSKKTMNSLVNVINYMWQDEKDNWEEIGCPDNHIFHEVNNIKNWITGSKEKGNGKT